MIEHSKVYWFNLIRSVVISLPVFAALSFAMIAPARAAEQMNVVFILADDLGWSDLACYGADLHESPNLDSLAETGVRFTQAYSASPVCTPTRASILTGKHPARLHMTIWHEASQNPPTDRKLIPPITVGDLPHKEFTLAEAFREAGYQTAHVGKWHLGTGGWYPETHGFDWNIGGTHWGAPPTFFHPYRGMFNTEYRYVPRLEGGREGEYLTDRLTDEALKFIEQAGDSPFFLNLSYHSPHTPIEAKPEDVEYFRGKLRDEYHHQNPTYAAMVRSLDANVGRILGGLDRLRIADRTAVVFASDNGGYIGNFRGTGVVTSNFPLRSGKGSLYEGGIRIPFMAKVPDLTSKGGECSAPISTTDLYPTLLEIAGVGTDEAKAGVLDGRSIAHLFRDPGASQMEAPLYFHYPHYYHAPETSPVSAVRKGDWKLIRFYEEDRVELYNLAEDPSESKDAASVQDQVAADLDAELARWLKQVDAQLPTPNTGGN